MRPISELPARARLLGGEDLALRVWDVSVGGLAIVADPRIAHLGPGDRTRLHLDLGRYGAFDLDVEVRHRGGDTGTVGMQLVSPPPEVTTAVGRYVAELLERGAPS